MNQKYQIIILLLVMILISGCVGLSTPIPISNKNPIFSKIQLVGSFFSNTSLSGFAKTQNNGNISVSPPVADKTLSWTIYSDDRFSAKHPQNWSYTKKSQGLSDWDQITFWSPDKYVLLDIFSGTKDTSRNLEEFQSANLLSWDDKIDYKLINTEKITFNGAPAYKTVFTWTGTEKQKERTMVIGTIIGTREYTIYYTSTITSYDAYLTTAQNIIDTIHLIPIKPGITKVPADTLSWLTYSDTRFNAQYPQNWTFTKNSQGLSDWDQITFWSPDKYVLLDIYSGKKDSSRTLDTFQNAQVLNWQKSKDFKLISTVKTTFLNAPAYKTVYTHTGNKEQKVKTSAINTIIGPREYSIYYNALTTSYDSYQSKVQSIIDTIYIIPITTRVPTVRTTITKPVTTIKKSVTNNIAILIYASPEKIISPEDLKIGDLIQMSVSDSRYDKDHGFRIENIFPQTNQFLIKEIIWFKTDNRWITMGGDTGRLITSGALMRDYPYKFGQAPEPVQKKCIICPNGPMTQCSKDDLIFSDC